MTWYSALLLLIIGWVLGYLSAWFCLSRARDEAEMGLEIAKSDLRVDKQIIDCLDYRLGQLDTERMIREGLNHE